MVERIHTVGRDRSGIGGRGFVGFPSQGSRVRSPPSALGKPCDRRPGGCCLLGQHVARSWPKRFEKTSRSHAGPCTQMPRKPAWLRAIVAVSAGQSSLADKSSKPGVAGAVWRACRFSDRVAWTRLVDQQVKRDLIPGRCLSTGWLGASRHRAPRERGGNIPPTFCGYTRNRTSNRKTSLCRDFVPSGTRVCPHFPASYLHGKEGSRMVQSVSLQAATLSRCRTD